MIHGTDPSDVPVERLPGVGPQRAAELASLGIRTAADLLFYFPFRYDDYRFRSVRELSDGDRATIRVRVAGFPRLSFFGRNRSRMACLVEESGFPLTAVWFNQPYLRDRLEPGKEVVLNGKWDARRRQLTVMTTEFPDQKTRRAGNLAPVYRLSGSLTQSAMRKLVDFALQRYASALPELLPESLVARYGLMKRSEAVERLHRPGVDEELYRRARERMAYEELFLFQLKLQAYRAVSRSRADGVAHRVDMEKVRAFVRGLPFRLTESQKQALAEILHDLKQPYAMNRLLQGDVGSGKTVVAAAALYAVATAGAQGAVMAPTEILAEQHKRVLERLLAPHGVQVDLLTGSMSERHRRDVKASIAIGLTDVVVGTHALIQEDVHFRNLGLVVTDEQHRFGVQQRSLLRKKGHAPDILMMTATPIPRTLAISLFGDLDVSTLRERPAGRKPVRTYWVKPDRMDRVVAWIRREIASGRQAYVVCPLIEESDKLDVQNAVDMYDRLRFQMPEANVGLLHGRLSPEEKESVMRRFVAGEVQVLVSTTVVEVGVDVPNATIMVVYDADRFGLSQLHQLRGRVGRGEHASWCVLVADPKTEAGVERMRIMTQTDDGFEIARMDLEMRGPGEFFGTRQSGLPEFRVADLSADLELLERARDDAARLVASHEFWTGVEYAPLRQWLDREGVLSGERVD